MKLLVAKGEKKKKDGTVEYTQSIGSNDADETVPEEDNGEGGIEYNLAVSPPLEDVETPAVSDMKAVDSDDKQISEMEMVSFMLLIFSPSLN